MADLNAFPGLKGLIRRARRHMSWPRLTVAFGPPLLLLSVFAIAAWFGLFERMGEAFNAIALIVLFLGMAGLIWRGLVTYRAPSEGEAVSALDRGSELRPLSTLADHPARITPQSQQLWTAHKARLLKAARRLKLPNLAAQWRKADPLYLRFIVPALLIVAVGVAGSQAGPRFASALRPDFGSLFGASDLRIDAWVTPPPYTNRAPIFLTEEMTTIATPQGSELTVRVLARSAPRLILEREDGDTDRIRMEKTPDGAWESVITVTDVDRFRVDWWGTRAEWGFDLSPDDAPTARFVEAPVATPLDKVGFTWIVSDDYGVEKLYLELTRPAEGERAEQTDRVEIIMDEIAPLSADNDEELDLTRHKWAGLELTLRLVAVDAAGQEGYSEPLTFEVPGKLLLQPLARATQEIRLEVLRETDPYPERETSYGALRQDAMNFEAVNRLETAPDDIQRAALMLDSLTWRPEEFFEDSSIYLGLRRARHILQQAISLEEAQESEAILWMMALRAEYGSLADAAAALMAAKRALERALRDGASEEEIRRLTEAFKEAAKNYIAAKIAEAMQNGGEAPPNPLGMDGEMGEGGPNLGANDLEDMLNALSDLTETGAADQARQLLSDITNLLENLEFQQGGGGQSADGFPMPGQEGEPNENDSVPENEQAMRDMVERLSKLLGDQRELNDDTMRSGQRDPFSNALPGESAEELAERQGEINDQLSELEGALREALEGAEEEGATGGVDPERLDEVRRAQRRAQDALERGDFRQAQRFQEEATEGLRELANDVGDQLDQLRGEVDEYDGDETDPFGNPIGGRDDDNSIEIPEEAERQRAKDILDEIRRRFGDAEDEAEKDYLDRLLDRF